MSPPFDNVDMWPPVGTEIAVSSTRRDKDAAGVVIVCDDRGVRLKLASGRVRFYPWPQVAFVEWGP